MSSLRNEYDATVTSRIAKQQGLNEAIARLPKTPVGEAREKLRDEIDAYNASIAKDDQYIAQLDQAIKARQLPEVLEARNARLRERIEAASTCFNALRDTYEIDKALDDAVSGLLDLLALRYKSRRENVEPPFMKVIEGAYREDTGLENVKGFENFSFTKIGDTLAVQLPRIRGTSSLDGQAVAHLIQCLLDLHGESLDHWVVPTNAMITNSTVTLFQDATLRNLRDMRLLMTEFIAKAKLQITSAIDDEQPIVPAHVAAAIGVPGTASEPIVGEASQMTIEQLRAMTPGSTITVDGRAR